MVCPIHNLKNTQLDVNPNIHKIVDNIKAITTNICFVIYSLHAICTQFLYQERSNAEDLKVVEEYGRFCKKYDYHVTTHLAIIM